jgi:hypothetical protein
MAYYLTRHLGQALDHIEDAHAKSSMQAALPQATLAALLMGPERCSYAHAIEDKCIAICGTPQTLVSSLSVNAMRAITAYDWQDQPPTFRM